MSSTLFASILLLIAACVSGQDTLTNKLVDAIEEVVSADDAMAPFVEDIEQPEEGGPGVCLVNRTVSYNTTETVIKIETITSTHFCLDFSAGFKCTKEERREIPTQVPTVKERTEMIRECCEQFLFVEGKCVAITTPAPSTMAPSMAPSRLGGSQAPPAASTGKPNSVAVVASVMPLITLLAAYLM